MKCIYCGQSEYPGCCREWLRGECYRYDELGMVDDESCNCQDCKEEGEE